MGHRCNMVIIEGGETRVFYDHWAATRLDFALFWGPDVARAFVEQRDAIQHQLLDDVWCEGACVIDFDRAHLLWFGGEDVQTYPELTLTFLEMMQPQWVGWTIDWAEEGILDIAGKVGVPRSEVLSHTFHDEWERLSPARIVTDNDLFYLAAEAVISCARGGKRRFAVVDGHFESLVHNDTTEQHIETLIGEFSLDEFRSEVDATSDWDGARWGADFDFDTRRLQIWCGEPQGGEFRVHLAEAWKGWDIRFTGPDFLWHQSLIPDFDWPALGAPAQKRVIQSLRYRLDTPHENPIQGLVKGLRDRNPGSDIEVNPLVWEQRQPNTDNANDMMALLDRIEAKLNA